MSVESRLSRGPATPLKEDLMKSILFLSSLVFALSSFAQDTIKFQSPYASVRDRMDSLSYFADSYPPNVEDSLQLVAAQEFFHSIANDLESLATQFPDSARLRLSLGELYKMGHNLDIEGSWKKADLNLKEAIDLDPDSPEAYFTLGLLYVNSDIRLASKAKDLFKEAIDHSDGHPDPYIYQGLAFANLYQAKNQDALEAIDEFLRLKPENKQGISLRNMILKKLQR